MRHAANVDLQCLDIVSIATIKAPLWRMAEIRFGNGTEFVGAGVAYQLQSIPGAPVLRGGEDVRTRTFQLCRPRGFRVEPYSASSNNEYRVIFAEGQWAFLATCSKDVVTTRTSTQ